jgi:hypothetical protein
MPAACVDSSLQMSISAETIHTGSHFEFPSEYKNTNPRPFPSPKLGTKLDVSESGMVV